MLAGRRVIPARGLSGAPMLLSAPIATASGHNEQLSLWSGIATRPIATRPIATRPIAALPKA
ncbi:hypothetical protein [Nocardioides guangzhouensis]|uniref:hypothetical protein n=1 Tax=Nocardioides guangzhouensis TaxID=2497878 RepID=UPI00143856C3|nr:hypothetical protein [Nocardioides guangzhouensis]